MNRVNLSRKEALLELDELSEKEKEIVANRKNKRKHNKKRH
jgi:hypothetical protein